MEKKIIIFCMVSCIMLIGVVGGIKVHGILSGPNSALALATVSTNNQQVVTPNITATSQPQKQQKKEFESVHNVEPIPDLVTLMLATPEKE
jgi:hypothetical protein